MDQVKEYVRTLSRTLEDLPLTQINQAIDLLHQTRCRGNRVFILGNGGSASTASHFVCDLGKNTRVDGWPNFRVVGLSDNMALLSAFANDDGYETVFSKQLEGSVEPNDVVIAISTSGNSPNVLEAIQHARVLGAHTIGLTGFDGGVLRGLVELEIHVPSAIIEHVEDVHLMIEHLICKTLKHRTLSETFGAVQTTVDARRDGAYKESRALLGELIDRVSSSPDVGQVLSRTLDLAVKNVGAASGSILALDEQGEVVEGAIAYGGEVRQHPARRLSEFLQRGLAGWVARQGQAALIKDTMTDPRWLRSDWDNSTGASRSAICAPLIQGDRLIGILTLVSIAPNQFTETDVALLMAIAVAASLSSSQLGSDSRAQSSTPDEALVNAQGSIPDPRREPPHTSEE